MFRIFSLKYCKTLRPCIFDLVMPQSHGVWPLVLSIQFGQSRTCRLACSGARESSATEITPNQPGIAVYWLFMASRDVVGLTVRHIWRNKGMSFYKVNGCVHITSVVLFQSFFINLLCSNFRTTPLSLEALHFSHASGLALEVGMTEKSLRWIAMTFMNALTFNAVPPAGQSFILRHVSVMWSYISFPAASPQVWHWLFWVKGCGMGCHGTCTQVLYTHSCHPRMNCNCIHDPLTLPSITRLKLKWVNTLINDHTCTTNYLHISLGFVLSAN